MFIENKGRKIFIERSEKIQELRYMKRGSDLHTSILDSGVDVRLVNTFLANRLKKLKGPQLISTEDKVKQLHESGGITAGGNALRRYLGVHQASDHDIFFQDFVSYACATIDTLFYKDIDICLFDEKPYEAFDLTAPMISFDGQNFDISDECSETLKTLVCHVRPDWIIHPKSTVGRIAKYGRNYGFKFVTTEFASMALLAGVDDASLSEALLHAR